jgi:hypothetical protein
MAEDIDENSIADRSFIINDISGQDLVVGVLEEDDNQSAKVPALNFSPPKENSQGQLLSPAIPLQMEFDDTNGYDSDGGACYDAVNEEGPLILDEEVVPDGATDELPAFLLPAEGEGVTTRMDDEVLINEPEDTFVLIADNDIDKLKVAQLKTELQRRGLPIDGKKQELKVRLKEAMVNRVPVRTANNPSANADVPTEIAGFSTSAKMESVNTVGRCC